jgi:hypothetical protein
MGKIAHSQIFVHTQGKELDRAAVSLLRPGQHARRRGPRQKECFDGPVLYLCSDA